MHIHNSCFFIGHRDISEDYDAPLLQTIETVIAENSISEFYVGNHGNFDRLAAQAVIEAKQKHPNIRLYLVLPHPRRFLRLPADFDDAFYPPDLPRSRYSIVLANRYMVDHVRCLIACAYRTQSNSGRILQYARARQEKGMLRVENLMQPLIEQAKKEAAAMSAAYWQEN